MTAILDRVRHLRLRRPVTEIGYGAFVSYSGGRDRDLIPQIQRAVEKLATRWYRRPSMRIFLDKTSISAGPRLWSKIESGLSRSAWLIVMASPEAAASEWVSREIEWWLEHRTTDTMLVVLTDGTLSWDDAINDFDPASTALPPCLRGRFAEEPVWVAVAWTEHGGKSTPDLERVVLDIASVIRGVPKDDLASAALKEHRRTMRWAGGAVAVLTALLVAALVFATMTVVQRGRAERNFRQATASRLAQDAATLLADPQHRADVRGIQEALVAHSLSPNLPLLLQALRSTTDVNKIIRTGKATQSGLELAPGDLDFSGATSAVAFTPDGSRLVTAGGQIRLWNTDTGKQEKKFDTLLPTQSVAVSPDGHRIVTGGLELRLWDANGTAIAGALEGHDGMVNCVVFSPDGRRVASAGRDGTVRLWNADNGSPVGGPLAGHRGPVHSVAFSPDGLRIYTGGDDHTLRTWDAGAQTPIGPPVDIGDQVTAVAASSDNRNVAVADYHGGVHLFDPRAGDAGDVLSTSSRNPLFAVAFSPNGRTLIAGGMDGPISVWNVDGRKLLGEGKGHSGWITGLAFSRDGSRLASSSSDGTVRLWYFDAHRSGVHQVVGPGATDGAPPFARSVSMSPDGERLAAGYRDGSVWIFDIDSGRPVLPAMRSDGGAVEASQFSPDGHRIASTGVDRKVRIWDADTGRLIAVSGPQHVATIVQLIFSPDGSRLLSTGADNITFVWDTNAQTLTGTPLAGHQEYYNNIAFSPDGDVIAGGGTDNTVRLWDAATGAPIGQPLPGHQNRVGRVAFSPDGRRMVSMSWDSLRVWDTGNWQLVGKPHYGSNIFGGLAVSPTGDFFVTSGFETLQRWSMETGEPIGDPMTGHSDMIDDVAVSADGSSIVSGGKDTMLRFWDAKTGLSVGDPLTVGPQSVTIIDRRVDRRVLSLNIDLAPDETVSAWVWPAPAAWRDDLCRKLTYNMSGRQWSQWVSPDIEYREQCRDLPKLADDD